MKTRQNNRHFLNNYKTKKYFASPDWQTFRSDNNTKGIVALISDFPMSALIDFLSSDILPSHVETASDLIAGLDFSYSTQ